MDGDVRRGTFVDFPSFFTSMCDGIVTCLSDRCQYRLKPSPVRCGTGATGTGLHPVEITCNREATLSYCTMRKHY
jgi:hypothetical protein